MPQLIGEFECKIDAKGRMRLPSTLLKQLGEQEQYSFVINRDLDGNLTMYTREVWEKLSKKVNNLNIYVKSNRAFIRFFHRGVTEVTTDSSDRILLTKKLLEYAGIKKEVILTAFADRIEIWDPQRYEETNIDPEDFSDLAQQVMGGINLNQDEE